MAQFCLHVILEDNFIIVNQSWTSQTICSANAICPGALILNSQVEGQPTTVWLM